MGSLLDSWQRPCLLALPSPLPHGDGGRLPGHHVPLHPLHLPPRRGSGEGHRGSGRRLSHLRCRHIQHGGFDNLLLCYTKTTLHLQVGRVVAGLLCDQQRLHPMTITMMATAGASV